MDRENIFNEIDNLALQNIPFWVMISFDKKKIELYKLTDLSNELIFFSFPHFSLETHFIPTEITVEIEKNPVSIEQYKQDFYEVQKELCYGNSYLTNLTFETQIALNTDLKTIYQQAKAKYKLFYKDELVCFSPETFITIKNNEIATFPMKGTIDASLPNAEKQLLNNLKEQYEHNTIVDLLRNDLSMVAKNVQVTQFRYIEEIATSRGNILQMSSKITGKLLKEYECKIGTILNCMLPAGSISGAPKEKTLEIILENESHNRGFYTGIMGFFDGKNFDSTVLIRFIEKRNNQFYYKSGGGITHLSQAEEEYNEMIQKIYVPTI